MFQGRKYKTGQERPCPYPLGTIILYNMGKGNKARNKKHIHDAPGWVNTRSKASHLGREAREWWVAGFRLM